GRALAQYRRRYLQADVAVAQRVGGLGHAQRLPVFEHQAQALFELQLRVDGVVLEAQLQTDAAAFDDRARVHVQRNGPEGGGQRAVLPLRRLLGARANGTVVAIRDGQTDRLRDRRPAGPLVDDLHVDTDVGE